MSNIQQGMSNAEVKYARLHFEIRQSLFDVRHSLASTHLTSTPNRNTLSARLGGARRLVRLCGANAGDKDRNEFVDFTEHGSSLPAGSSSGFFRMISSQARVSRNSFRQIFIL